MRKEYLDTRQSFKRRDHALNVTVFQDVAEKTSTDTQYQQHTSIENQILLDSVANCKRLPQIRKKRHPVRCRFHKKRVDHDL